MLPRLLDIDPRADGPWRAAPWRADDPASDRLASWGGGGLALALLEQDPAALIVSVGEGVVRGLPTAARAAVAGRSPLTGSYGDGQVGSDFARRLAAVADAIRFTGACAPTASGRGRVCAIGSDGVARAMEIDGLAGASSLEVHARLQRELGPCATLSIGPAGERGARIASLAAGSAGSEGPLHFVGRGGLGALLGAKGWKAIAIENAPLAPLASDRPSELLRALSASPRLEQRARGGTLELAQAALARADLDGFAADAAQLRDFVDGVERARAQSHGCQGCPTPCGWTFRREGGAGQAARFGAAQALGLELGLPRFEDALELLASCDQRGLDAKEVGAALAAYVRAFPSSRGDLRVFARLLDEAWRDSGANSLSAGAVSAARAWGQSVSHARGAAVRVDKNLASLLGQCASARGSDPMRAFPFLAADNSSLGRLRELCAPLDLPAGSEDPRSPIGKGRLVGWHEDLALALDLSGFCAFSASALISDGGASLDDLARWIAPRALRESPNFDARPAEVWLEAGAALAQAQRRFNSRFDPEGAERMSDDLRAKLAPAGMWPEYRAYRDDRRAFQRGDTDSASLQSPALPPLEASRRAGRVRLRAFGSLAQRLDGEGWVQLDLPARVDAVLIAGAAQHPRAAASLLREGATLPAIYRNGARVEPGELVFDGEALDLLLVVGGG